MPHHFATHYLYGNAAPENAVRTESGTSLQVQRNVRTARMYEKATFSVEQERRDRTIVANGITDEIDLVIVNVKTRDASPTVVADVKSVSRCSQPHRLLQIGTACGERVPLRIQDR